MRILALVYESDAGPGVFAEAIRERGAEVEEWFVPDAAEPPADPFGYDAVMTFGGSMHTDEEGKHPWLRGQRELVGGLLEAGRPLLGACLGAQLLAEAAGGQVRRMPAGYEIGWFRTEVLAEAAGDPLLGPMAPGFESFNWHRYECLLPAGAVTLARSERCVHAFRLGDAAWGIQFHAEVTLADANSWIDEWEGAEDAAGGPEPAALRAQTADRIAPWNEAGHALCTRFLEAAVRSPSI